MLVQHVLIVVRNWILMLISVRLVAIISGKMCVPSVVLVFPVMMLSALPRVLKVRHAGVKMGQDDLQVAQGPGFQRRVRR